MVAWLSSTGHALHSPYLSHTYPAQGHRSPRRCRGWELEQRDCGAILGWELLLTAER